MQKNSHTRSIIPAYWFATPILLGLLDQAAKQYALQHFPELGDFLRDPGFFELALFKNTGAVFSLPIPIPVVSLLSILVLVGLALRIHSRHIAGIELLPWLFVFSGAGSNLLDRIVRGYTVDYLVFFGRSAINLADILIVIGVGLLLFHHKRRGKQVDHAVSSGYHVRAKTKGGLHAHRQIDSALRNHDSLDHG